MELSKALRLEAPVLMAFSGAGGKTTAMFQLARQLSQPPVERVLVSASTHLGVSQCQMADRHFSIASPEDIPLLLADPPPGVLLFTGQPVEDERLAGLDPLGLDALHGAARANGWSLLVEVDGSRQRPLKAPAGHEPPIPTWVEAVVVLAGLSAVGQPLSASFVHRPEQFAFLAGLEPGDPISAEAVARVLAHPQGGLKNIPPAARRIALLNQADNESLQSVARTIAEQLNDTYDSVLISALNPPAGRPEVYAVYEPVAGILLAAGEARRFGQPKQLIEWRGEPLVRRAARVALQAGLRPVIVVSGAYAAEIEAAVAGLPVLVQHNPAWELGQGSSVAAGVRALPSVTGAAVFLLADQPYINPQIVAALVELHRLGLEPVLAPLVDGQRANPALFDRKTFPALAELAGEAGGRALFSRFPVRWVEWHDRSLLQDIDTPEDFQRLIDQEHSGGKPFDAG